MKNDYCLYLEDILEAIGKIEKYTQGQTLEQFRSDDKTVDAVIRNFTIIGEAAKHVPQSIRKNYPGIPWKAMAGMRDKLVHEYFGVKYDVVWDTIEKRLPQLRLLIEEVLKRLDAKPKKVDS